MMTSGEVKSPLYYLGKAHNFLEQAELVARGSSSAAGSSYSSLCLNLAREYIRLAEVAELIDLRDVNSGITPDGE